jgi:hypothetical protein
MAQSTRAAQIVETLPTLYFQDALLRRVVEALAGRLAEGQFDLQQVMNAHWVDTADDSATAALGQRPLDLAGIGALVPLVPFPDEEAARRTPETVLVDAATVLSGPGGAPLTVDQLLVGQRIFVGGARQPDESVLAARISIGQPSPPDSFEVTLLGRLSQITPPTVVDPVGRLVVLTGRTGADMFRQRLTLTAEAFLDGVGTAPAILKMVAATMGWGRLRGTFADWSVAWTPREPVFQALAEGAPAPIRLRELPLLPATTPIAQRVKAGAQWIETAGSSFVVQPTIQIKALDLPVLIPTVVSLDAQVAIATLVALETVKHEDGELVEQDVTLRIEGQADGTLRGTLTEHRLPSGGVTETDVSDRIRVRTSGLRVDRPGASEFLRGGTDDRTAGLVVSDGRRAIRLTARTEGIWANAVRVAHADGASLELRYDPALAVGGPPSPEAAVYVETPTLDDLLAGQSRLVTAQDFTFTIPERQSHWLYFDHAGAAVFDATQWDLTVFDEPPADEEDPDLLFQQYPAKGIYDYAAFDGTVFPQEFLRAFRFDQPGSVFDQASYNETPEQVEILLGWQEGQRATIRLEVPLAGPADRQRLAFLPEMVRKVKPAGIKVILAQRLLDAQPLAERPPHLRLAMGEAQPLADALHLQLGLSLGEARPPLGELVIGVLDVSHWNASHFDTRG